MINDIKDVKAPVDLPSAFVWVWVVLAVILVTTAVVFLFLWLKKRPAQKEKTEIPVVLPWDKAYQRLENLRLRKWIEQGYFKPFYIELSDIVRHYLEDRFNIKAPEMTTEEFLSSLKNSPALDNEQQQTLKEFLFTCDMVKFAKHQPTGFDAQKSFDLAKQLIDQTHGI